MATAPRRHPSTTPLAIALAIGLAASAALYFLSTSNHDAPGLEYDEVHQATGAFRYVGKDTRLFVAAEILGLPTLNMRYSGAIKSAIYGLFMKVSGESFTIASWRFLGVFFAMAGILYFAYRARREHRATTIALILAFVVLDLTVLLCVRHDRGPVALALALRLAFLSVALSLSPRAVPRHFLILGALVAFSTFEKLSSAVLLGPLICFLAMPEFRHARYSWAAVRGGLLGGIPLLAINAHSLLKGNGLISLSGISGENDHSLPAFGRHLYEYLAIGHGNWARFEMTGISAPHWVHTLEVSLVVVLSLILAFIFMPVRRTNDLARLGFHMLCAWLSIGLLLFVLPENCVEHHWIIGTPFLGAAVALGWRVRPKGAFEGRILVIVTLALLAWRLPTLVQVRSEFAEPKTSARFSPSFTRIAEFATRAPKGTFFACAGWGLAAQMICLSQGDETRIREYIFRDDPLTALKTDVKGFQTIYILRPSLIGQVGRAHTLLTEARTLEGFREAPLERELTTLPDLEILKLIRDS